MEQKGMERNLVVFLFVLVLMAFSFAERDSKKMERFYTAGVLLKKAQNATATVSPKPSMPVSKN